MISFFLVPITLEFCIVLCWDQYATHYGAENLDNTLTFNMAGIALNLNMSFQHYRGCISVEGDSFDKQHFNEISTFITIIVFYYSNTEVFYSDFVKITVFLCQMSCNVHSA